MWIHPPEPNKPSPLISCILDNLINPFSSTLWASLSFCKCCHFKANPFWSHLLSWHSYVRTSSALSEAYASITTFTWTKNAGQIQVESRFDLENTFPMCETTPDTEVGRALLPTQGRIWVKNGGQGAFTAWLRGMAFVGDLTTSQIFSFSFTLIICTFWCLVDAYKALKYMNMSFLGTLWQRSTSLHLILTSASSRCTCSF